MRRSCTLHHADGIGIRFRVKVVGVWTLGYRVIGAGLRYRVKVGGQDRFRVKVREIIGVRAGVGLGLL
jgi:hypothetical protein